MKVIGVRFRKAGKVYFFDPLDMDIKQGMNVIVETARGVEYGFVVMGVRDVEEEKIVQPLKPVLRIATPEDDMIQKQNHEKEQAAFGICLEKIKKHGLDMKLIDSEYTFDNNKPFNPINEVIKLILLFSVSHSKPRTTKAKRCRQKIVNR